MARCEPQDPPARFPPAAPDAVHDSPPRWRKVLYAQQPYEDTHTGETFLEDLVVNATIPQRDYATVVWSTLVVDQQLSTVAAVGSASFNVYKVSKRPLGTVQEGSRNLYLRLLVVVLLVRRVSCSSQLGDMPRCPTCLFEAGAALFVCPTPCPAGTCRAPSLLGSCCL
jgi:hypothetical protein